MSVEVTMPQLSDTMSEGTILNWLKKEGDYVKRGDALAEVATDKADLEIESFHEGTLAKINTPVGAKVKVGTVIAVIGTAPGADAGTPRPAVNSQPTHEAVAGTVGAGSPESPSGPSVTPSGLAANNKPSAHLGVAQIPSKLSSPAPLQTPGAVGERVKISPLARNVAMAHGIDLTQVHGSGDGGRIVRRDIDPLIENLAAASGLVEGSTAAKPSAPYPTSVLSAPVGKQFEPLSRMRSTIAQRMVESVTTIPHFYVTAKVMMSEVTRLKNSLRTLPQYEGITFNHIMVKAVALALRQYPIINSAFKESGILQPTEVNIGIVTAVNGGLLIPVVKRADQQPLADIVADARALVQRARAGRPKQEDLIDGTFSISNMGAYSVESFTAIINPGQGAILAVSAIEQEPVVVAGEIKIADVVRLTLSVDHRIIDGVMAGAYLTELKRLLEDPVLLLA